MTFPALLHFVLTNWWPFVGACVLLTVIGSAIEDMFKGVAAIIRAARGSTP